VVNLCALSDVREIELQ
jgi:hypothetical protein